MGTGKEQKITITARTKLSESEIETAVKEAEIYAERDKAIKEAIDIKNEADGLVFSAERMLKEMEEKTEDETGVTADDKEKLTREKDILAGVIADKTPENMTEADVATVKAAIEEFTKTLHEFSGKVYAHAQAQGGDGGGAEGCNGNCGGPCCSGHGGNDGVFEGDYTEQ
jgi:molecular chaperone DnaK